MDRLAPRDFARNHRRGLLIVATGVFVLSFDALLVRLADTSPWDLVFWRGLLMALTLGSILLVKALRGPGPCLRPRGGLLRAGAIAGLGLFLFPASLEFTATANTVVILTTAPFFAALLSRLMLGEPVPTRTRVAIVVVFAGIAGIFSGSLSAGLVLGDVLALVAAAVLGLNKTVLRSLPGLSRIGVTCVSGIVAALLCLPMASPLNLDPGTYAVLAVTGLVQMPLAMVLVSTGTRYLPAAEVSLLLLIETVLAPVWVWLAVGEEPPSATYAGGAVIVITLAIHSWLGLRAAQSTSPPTPDRT